MLLQPEFGAFNVRILAYYGRWPISRVIEDDISATTCFWEICPTDPLYRRGDSLSDITVYGCFYRVETSPTIVAKK